MLVSYLDNVKKTHKTSFYSNVFVTRPFIIWSPRLKSKALSFWQILKLFALPLLFFSLTNGWHPFWGIIKKTRQMTAGISLELVVKFRYSEKAKKFEKISQFFWRYLAASKTVFPEHLNFKVSTKFRNIKGIFLLPLKPLYNNA